MGLSDRQLLHFVSRMPFVPSAKLVEISASRPQPRPERHPNFNSLLYYIGV